MKNISQTFNGKALTKIWPYKNPQGEIIGAVARYDGLNGKGVVPYFKPSGEGFTNGGATVPRPLFGLEHMPQTYNDAPLYIVEGEKCAAALQSLGLPCFTSCGGSSQVNQADWKILDGYTHFVVLPDNDEAGEKYAQAVTQTLAQFTPKPNVKWVRIPNLLEKGDVADWLQSQLPSWNGFDPVPSENRDAILQSFKKLCDDCSQQPSSQVNAEISDWEAPITLDNYALPEWPKNILPLTIRQYILELTESTETPIELPALMTLAVLSCACAGKYNVNPKPSYYESLNLWFCVALPPGNRKSEIVKAVTKPLRAWESQQQKEVLNKIIEAESMHKTLTERIHKQRKKAADAKSEEERIELQNEVLKLEYELPKIPTFPRLWTSDVTPEKLAVMLSENNERMAIIADEGGIFENMGGRYSGGKPNIDIFLQGHSASASRTDRQGRDSVILSEPCLTMGISPQPDVIKGLSANPQFKGRGLLGRFLFALPKSIMGYRTGDTLPIAPETEQKFHDLVAAILNLPIPKVENGQKIIPSLILSEQAQINFKGFHKKIEIELGVDGEFEFVPDWGGKFVGAVLRIAGVLHVARHAHDNPLNHPIHEIDLDDAIQIGEVLKAHTLAAFDLMGRDTNTEGARAICKWIQRKQLSKFTQRDCHHALDSVFKTAPQVSAALQILIDRHYIRQILQSTVHHRPSKIFEVNPLALK